MIRRGLTLVEMLVVVAVLAVLVGVLLPALTRARADADRAACANKLQEIGRALNRYALGHGGRLPEARAMPQPIAVGGGRRSLVQVLASHMPPSSAAFQCPGDTVYVYAVCGSSYFYDPEASGRDILALRRSARSGRGPVVLAGDADNMTVWAAARRIEAPPFHGPRNLLLIGGEVIEEAEDAPPRF